MAGGAVPGELSVSPQLINPTLAAQSPAAVPLPAPTVSKPSGAASPPLPSGPTPSFQDIESESDSDSSGYGFDEDEEEAVNVAAASVFEPGQIDAMMHYLKEKGLFAFVTRFVQEEQMPIPILLLAFGILIPQGTVPSLQDLMRVLRMACSRVLRNRERLDQYSSVDDAVELIRKSKKIMILTGAGVSTSCGIPDFRSPTGLYARLKEEHWELEDPQEMFDLPYFREKPNVFYSFAKEIYPSNFTPSPCHRFVKVLEENDKLLRNYTQNIDGLFEQVGVKNMINCHGSFATASCLRCRTRFPGSHIEADVFAQRVPLCPICTKQDEEEAARKEKAKGKGKAKATWQEEEEEEPELGEWEGKPLIKPDIVFFGEMLSNEFDRKLLLDREEVDLLIVIGTSLRVSPVAQIVNHLPHSIPQILINRDPITHANFDLVLLGDGDTIITYLSHALGASFDLSRAPVAGGASSVATRLESEVKEGKIVPERVAESHVWLFPGHNGGRWVELVRRAYESESDDEDEQRKGGKPDETLGLSNEVREGGLQVPMTRENSGSRSRTRSPSPEEGDGEVKKARLTSPAPDVLQ